MKRPPQCYVNLKLKSKTAFYTSDRSKSKICQPTNIFDQSTDNYPKNSNCDVIIYNNIIYLLNNNHRVYRVVFDSVNFVVEKFDVYVANISVFCNYRNKNIWQIQHALLMFITFYIIYIIV